MLVMIDLFLYRGNRIVWEIQELSSDFLNIKLVSRINSRRRKMITKKIILGDLEDWDYELYDLQHSELNKCDYQDIKKHCRYIKTVLMKAEVVYEAINKKKGS